MDLQFLLATSNISEHLFSTTGNVLNNRRRSLTPANLESQILLHLHNGGGHAVP